MAVARFKDLCLDANTPSRLGEFWAAVLDLAWEPDDTGEGRLVGSSDRHTIWVNQVPEAKSVKHRVHFDVYAERLADLEALGATVALAEGGGRRWTVMADPEGGEFCAFLRDELPAARFYALVVDSVDPAAQARWWAEVFGASVVDDERGFSSTVDVPGLPVAALDFIPVPEPKSVKNRIHWDVDVAAVPPLLDLGAVMVRPRGADLAWDVLADPEGNEFCVFVD